MTAEFQMLPGQSQEQTLTHTLTPQQLQSLNLLAVPVMQLDELIREELHENPVLSLDDGCRDAEGMDPLEPEDPSANGQETAVSETAADYGDLHSYPDSAPAQDRMMDENRDDFSEGLERMLAEDNSDWSQFTGDSSSGSEEEEERRQYQMESLTADPQIEEMLLAQLREAEVPQELERPVAEILGSIDDHGYLRTPLPDIAQAAECDVETAERALRVVQSLEPPGIGARDLRECWLLQLERRGEKETPLWHLVADHLEEISRNKFPQVAEEMHLSIDELYDLRARLKHLAPFPASLNAASHAAYILPEATVVPDGDEFKVIPNRESLPRLMVSRRYLKMLEDPNVPEDAKAFIREKLTNGKGLMRLLKERQSTIQRVAELIVANQHDYFTQGPQALRPMTMQEIADKIGRNESTVSRAVADKYLQTPSGLVPFRNFFSGGYAAEDGSEISSHGVKELIRDAVEKEDPGKPLSDSKLEKILQEHGLTVARRTIAKYRDELGIPSSSQRKMH